MSGDDHVFTREQLVEALTELGQIAYDAGRVIDMAIYGGSCLMLVSNFRFASADVDAVASEDQRFIDHAAQTIAARRGWPRDWLNDGVRTFLSPRVERLEQHELFRTYPSEQTPGLRAFVPAPEYMLAMKLMALRLDAASGQKDLEDILNLMQVAGIKEKGDIVRLASGFYPEARASAKLVLAIDYLWNEHNRRLERPTHEAPQYLGRSSPKS